ncbi:unnamed protein product [Paramecium sonneborni]|uniref:Uncharacterized protein n=1 Tax=Paramecium sonneborni TaxID=65129 RepID=A0A8S1P4A2_9CILI|nr:unnamed protein product [Paramecium sonneborni]
MQEQNSQNKLQKWMQKASQKKMNKITESKKYNKDNQEKNLINIEEFKIEIDFLDQKQGKLIKQQEDLIKKVEKKFQNNGRENIDKKIILNFDRKNERLKLNNPQSTNIDQHKQYEEEMSQEEQKQEKEKKLKFDQIEKRREDCQDLTNFEKTSKVLIAQDDLQGEKKINSNLVIKTQKNGDRCVKQILKQQKLTQNIKTEQISEVKQRNPTEEQQSQDLASQCKQYENQFKKLKQKKHPKIMIQSNGKLKKHNKLPNMIVDACIQTDNTSDIHGQEILNLIILEQDIVYQLHQLHEKILKLLNNQI